MTISLTLERALSPDLTLIVVVNLACLNPFNANSDQGKIVAFSSESEVRYLLVVDRRGRPSVTSLAGLSDRELTTLLSG